MRVWAGIAGARWRVASASCAGSVVKGPRHRSRWRARAGAAPGVGDGEPPPSKAYAEQRRVSLCMRSCSGRGGSGAQGARTKCRTTVAVPCPPSFIACLVSTCPHARRRSPRPVRLPFCCPGEGGVGHANGFSFLSARTTPCIDALRACLSSPRPSLGCAILSLPRVASSRMYCPLRRLTTPAIRPFHRCLPHVLPSPSKSTQARPRPP